MTLEEYAREYVKTLMSTPNGLGQCVHPTLGRSDRIIIKMNRLFGSVPTELAIDKELQSIKESNNV